MKESNHQYGSFWLRLFAYLFDFLLFGFIPLIFLLVLVSFAQTTRDIWIGLLWIGWVIICLEWLFMLLYQIFTYLRLRASLGKMLAGLEIVKEDGEKPTLSDSLMRFPIGYAVSAIFWNLGFLWIFRDKKRKGFHDYIAETVVIKKGSAESLAIALLLLVILIIFLIYSIYTVGESREVWISLYNDIERLLQILG